jgi:hypothetical protein
MMSTPLLQYLESRNKDAIPAKGALPDKREWVEFSEFELKGTRLCLCDSWCPYDGVMTELPPGKYQVKALCYTYGGEVRVAALRVALPGTQGEPGEAVGEFGVDVGAVGITDIDLVETLDDDSYVEWVESYSHADGNPPAGRHPCPDAGTEMLFTESGWGDGWYTAHALMQDGQAVGVEVTFIEQEDEPYPFDLDRNIPTPPAPEETALLDDLIAVAKEIALSTEPIDRDACIAAFGALYAAHGLPQPEFLFSTSLMNMRDRAHQMIPEDGDLEDAAGEDLTLIPNDRRDAENAVAKRKIGIWQYARVPLEFAHDLSIRKHDAEERAGASRDGAWDETWGMETTTWGEILHIVTGLASEKLGLREPDEKFRLAAQALATCGGAACYERYCFISERPARIAHPAVIPGATAGRCRIEWRDGFVCDEAIDD